MQLSAELVEQDRFVGCWYDSIHNILDTKTFKGKSLIKG